MKQRSEILLTQLCDEIDFLKEEVEYWKSKYEQEKQERWDEFKKQEKLVQKGVANALMFALSDLTDKVIAKYASQNLAAKATSSDQSKISACCVGKRKTHNGLKFQYA